MFGKLKSYIHILGKLNLLEVKKQTNNQNNWLEVKKKSNNLVWGSTKTKWLELQPKR